MKDLFKILLVAVGISVFITACDTDAEIKDPANLTDPDRSEQYYEQLRAYKQTDHPVAFGWSPSPQYSMGSMPSGVSWSPTLATMKQMSARVPFFCCT